jgi:hypothetical protein
MNPCPDTAVAVPMPSSADLGRLFGSVVINHEPGRRYELTLVDPDGGRITYEFHPTGNECVLLASVSVAR